MNVLVRLRRSKLSKSFRLVSSIVIEGGMPSGVVYEHVEPTVTLDGYFNGFGDLRGYRNVCLDEQGFARLRPRCP